MALSEGGAVTIEFYSRLNITHCLFDNNTAQSAGVIYGGDYVILEKKDTNFYNNNATSNGGAVGILRDVQLLITNCTLEGNSAGRQGGVYTGRR